MAKETFTTPQGAFAWPHLNVPDTKFKPEGEYHLKMSLSIDDPAVARLIELVDQRQQEKLAEVKAAAPAAQKAKWKIVHKPYEMQVNDQGEETGMVTLHFKTKASGVNSRTGEPWVRKVPVFDANAKPVQSLPEIWGGTVGRVSFSLATAAVSTQAGVTCRLQLEAVQIISLVGPGAGSAESNGFTPVDGGDFDGSTATDGGTGGDTTTEDMDSIQAF